MDLTCGSFVIDNKNNILLCRVTGTKEDWTVPKGLPNEGEQLLEAAKRELKEETGIVIDDHPYICWNMGVLEYTHKNKAIVGFLFKLTNVITQTLACNSFFTDFKTGNRLPEVDLFRWEPVEHAKTIMRPEQVKLLMECGAYKCA
jgi:8-oxo-dGTP pyrophosphatase MutT (NUDIX family)